MSQAIVRWRLEGRRQLYIQTNAIYSISRAYFQTIKKDYILSLNKFDLLFQIYLNISIKCISLFLIDQIPICLMYYF